MSTTISRSTPHKSLKEAITLLSMLNEYPESPKENQPKDISVLASIYQLSFQHEKQISESLAFLSNTTHDSAKVMAVCLEEARDGRSCTIRLTSNNGDINKVVLGFKLMATILEQGASRANSKDDDTKALFRCIVTLDYCRILSRLRSKHAKKSSRSKGKSVLITLLDTAIREQSIKPSPNITVMELADILTKITILKSLFLKFEDIQEHSAASSAVQDAAMELITQMHSLASSTKLELALNSSKALDPELKRFLPEAVGKLGRYYSICRDLVCIARSEEYPMFKSINIETCPISRPSQPSNVDWRLHPLTVLQNILRPRTVEQSQSFKPLLEKCLGKPIQVIVEEFREATAEYHRLVKVHAEIQLLFFYELNLERKRPRTICSSKSACYLCDLFFRLHGQYYVPRTHGRLYHKWTLPDWHVLLPEMRRRDFDVLLRNFSDILKVKIRVALDRGPVRTHYPNESTQIRSLSPTTKLPERVIANDPICFEDPLSLDSTRPDPMSSEPPPKVEHIADATSSSIAPSTTTLCPPAQGSITPKESPSQAASENAHRPPPLPTLSPSSTASPKADDELTEGEPIRRRILHPNISIKTGTSRLSLHLSSDTTTSLDPNIVSETSSRCSVRVKWLQSAEAENIDSRATNAEGLNYDTEVNFRHDATSPPTELTLRRGEDFVSIQYTFDGVR